MLAQSQEKNVVKPKTGGQPIVLQRLSQPRKSSDIASSPTEIVTAKKELRYCQFPYRDCHSQERAQILPVPLQRLSQPRKSSDIASSPTKRRRTQNVSTTRSLVSGKKPEAVEVQEERDIRKISSEKARKIVMISNRWRNRNVIPKAYALAIKSRLGVSRHKFGELTRMLCKQGVNVENETAQRKLQQDILPQDLVVETHNFSFKNDQKEEYFRQTQAIFIDNIENYLFNLLNQYQSQNELSWHGGSIPEEEIWVKIGGDHGQGSLKVTLQTLNVEKPNSKFFTSIIAMANVPDNVKKFTDTKSML